MKNASSIETILGGSYIVRRDQGTSKRSTIQFQIWLGMMAFVLTCGLTAVSQQTIQPADRFQRMQNVTACGYGFGQCDEGLLSPAEAAQVRVIQHRMNVQACGYGIGECNEGFLSPDEVAQVSAIRHRMNVQACGYGIGECNEGLLLPAEVVDVSAIRHRMNVQACGYGIGECREDLLTTSESAVVKSMRARQANFVMSYPLPSMVETSTKVSTSFDTQINALYKALSISAGAPIAENGSYYGEPNKNGIPKTVQVTGYTRSNGTYVQGYYRSAPGTNPVR
jgi:ferredoxin